MGTYGPRIIAGIVALGLTAVAFAFLEPAKIPKKAEVVYFGLYRQICPPEPLLSKKEQAKAVLMLDVPMICPLKLAIPHA